MNRAQSEIQHFWTDDITFRIFSGFFNQINSRQWLLQPRSKCSIGLFILFSTLFRSFLLFRLYFLVLTENQYFKCWKTYFDRLWHTQNQAHTNRLHTILDFCFLRFYWCQFVCGVILVEINEPPIKYLFIWIFPLLSLPVVQTSRYRDIVQSTQELFYWVI